MSSRKRRSLLYIWSLRYFLILIASTLVVDSAALLVLHQNGLSNQREDMDRMARAIGEEAAAAGGLLPPGEQMGRWLDDKVREFDLNDRPIVAILDRNGQIVQQYPQFLPREASQLPERMQDILTNRAHIIELKPLPERMPLRVAVYPIPQPFSGYVLYFAPKAQVLQRVMPFSPFPQVFLVISMILIGLLVIYTLTKRLLGPIREAADASKQIVAGNYGIRLSYHHSGKEIRELMYSFREMADRLQHLESLRLQLLAGVTHELKTPITSISGLIQAVRDGVVRGEEAQVFLEMSLKETSRLQRMVEDLLDFNSFAAQSVAIRQERVNLGTALAEMISRWKHSLKQADVKVSFELPAAAQDWPVLSDPSRIEQILINLLNNACAATAPNGQISVRLCPHAGELHILVQDTGCGIPADEQDHIFEPFYRGRYKKNRVRGLGLGLPFSRLIARSLGGELSLTESSPQGTTFTLSLAAAADTR